MIWSKRFPFCLCIHLVEETGVPQTHILTNIQSLSFPIFKKHTSILQISTLFKSFQIYYFFHLFSKPTLALPTWLCSHKLCSSKERESSRESESERGREQSLLSPPKWVVVMQQTMQWTKTAVVINSMNECGQFTGKRAPLLWTLNLLS